MKSTAQKKQGRRGKLKHASNGNNTDRAMLSEIAYRAMTERGLEPEFPLRALHELASIHRPAHEFEGLRDMRDRLWASIDNDDSRDLDQLTVAESLDGGHVRILVAVADVDALVPKDSAIDDHAACNTTSVYTPAVMFPMLPLPLCFDLTSLNEGAERIAVVTDMVFDAGGSLVTANHYRANVRNHAKLAYRSVGMWLSGDGPIPEKILKVPGLDANLRLQDSIARLLADLRQHHGALSLVTLEPRAIFDGDVISALEPKWKNRATQLIEDFMIAANGANATYLASKNFPSIRRVLRSPERWDRIVKLASEAGEHLPVTPDAVALEQFLVRRSKAAPETFADLSLAVVKLIGRGEYALDPPGGEPPGHFALAVRDYTHSTAPNRRFPDLITQRLLKAAMAGTALPYTIVELEELARHCTAREDDVTKVERRMRKSAAALLLSGRIGQSFEAVVTGASEKGTWVRLYQPPVEGRLEHGFQGLDVGDPVSVKLVHTDIERGFIDFVRD
ncbi:MAG: RNB domain-containing ribonuclease [Luteolibacter sp.]